MGYTTDFTGQIKVDPPLSVQEVEYINKFNGTRRMNRQQGPYFVGGGGMMGQAEGEDIIDYNVPPRGQPGLWCNWKSTECGGFIEWDGGEKFYYAEEWMTFLIKHFIGDNPEASKELPFLCKHNLNGVIEAQGEEASDKWSLIVVDNKVSRKEFVFSTPEVQRPHCEEYFHLNEK